MSPIWELTCEVKIAGFDVILNDNQRFNLPVGLFVHVYMLDLGGVV